MLWALPDDDALCAAATAVLLCKACGESPAAASAGLLEWLDRLSCATQSPQLIIAIAFRCANRLRAQPSVFSPWLGSDCVVEPL